MRKSPVLTVLAVLLLLGGLGIFIFSAVRGDSEFHLFLIIPVISSQDPLGIVGMLMFMAGLIMFPIARFMGHVGDMGRREEQAYQGGEFGSDRFGSGECEKGDVSYRGNVNVGREHSKPRIGGVVFIGPIPIVFGSERGIARWMIPAAAALAVIMVLMMVLPLLVM